MTEIGRELDVKQQKIVEERHLRRQVQEARDKMKRRFLTTVLAANEKEDSKSDISWNAVNAEYNTRFCRWRIQSHFCESGYQRRSRKKCGISAG